MKKIQLSKLIASLVASFAAAGVGTLATTPNIPTWYAALDKPFFSPPNWVFGPVWTVLYLMIGISLYLVWTAETTRSKERAYLLFTIQLMLNAAWSLTFFGAHLKWGGLLVILTLLVSIVATQRDFARISPRAAWLLYPYLAWVTFATCLNLALAILN